MAQTGNEVSVVIASLGGPSLEGTINSMLAGSLIPAEILLCIPEDHSGKATHLASDIVKVIPTQVRGQVKQRAFGFTKAIYPFVLQTDDDMLFEKDSLRDLVQYLSDLGPGNSIGPIYYGPNTRRCNHELQDGFVKNLFDCVICGAPWGQQKMGALTSIGLNYGVDDKYCTSELMEVDWLPGACALSFRNELITDDYFPFPGKAYCEDIFHSHYKKLKGVRLWIATRVRVYTEEPLSRLAREIVEKEIPIRRYYVQLTGGPQWRLRLYEVFCRIRSYFNS